MRALGWQLLTEFGADGLPGNERQLLAQVMEPIQGLELQPLQIERIQTAFIHAFSGTHDKANLPATGRICVRIWIQGNCAHQCGWGFFLVERSGNEPENGVAADETENVVELFLYRERDW